MSENTKQQWSKKQKLFLFGEKNVSTKQRKMSDENDFYMKKQKPKKKHTAVEREHTHNESNESEKKIAPQTTQQQLSFIFVGYRKLKRASGGTIH